MDPIKLITTLEAAAEGSEYLDFAIQRRFGLMKPVPAYTRSVDAAMSLIPAEWSIHQLQRRTDCRGSFTNWNAELFRASDVVLEFPSRGVAATAPLALCAAAMRVLQALEAAVSEEIDGPELPSPAAMRIANGGILLRTV